MNDVPVDNELIERYLLGKLTDAEVRSFKIRLGDDREFARKFRLISTFPEMMSEPGRLEYEQNLAKAAAPVAKKKTVRFPKTRNILWAAGVFIILAGIAFYFLTGPANNDESIVQRNIVTPKANVAVAKIIPVRTSRDSSMGANGNKRDTSARITATIPDVSLRTFELIKPADGMKFSVNETIVFNWKQKTDTFTRFYIVSEQSGQVVFWRGVRLGVRELKVPGSYLYPGNYSWYVGTKDVKRNFIITE